MNMQALQRQLRYATRFPANRVGLLTMGTAVLLLLAVWLFAWRPVAMENDMLNESVSQTRQSLIAMMRLQELRSDYDSTLHAVQSIETKLEQVIPLSVYVQRLNSLAQENQVQIINQSRKTGRLQRDFLPIYQDLVLEASYESIRRFLSGLNSLPTWTVVNELRVDRQRGSPMLKASLVLVTFQKQTSESAQ